MTADAPRSGAVHARAPGRVNLIGDHTDHTGGLVLPMAIDRCTDVVGTVSPRLVVRSADEAGVVDLVGPPWTPTTDTPAWGRYVAAVAAELDARRGLDATVTTTIPVGAGLSSSAALEVALALALGFDGHAHDLALLARRAEHRATGVPTGIMDQLCITTARAGHASLIDCTALTVDHVPVPDDVAVVVRFVAHRTIVGSGYAARVRECAAAEAVVGPLRAATRAELSAIADPVVAARARHVVSENERVVAFADALRAGDLAAAGEAMDESHVSLRDDFAVSTPTVDAAVAALAATPGVHGARMTGGGFGGCIVGLCDPDARVDGWRMRPVGAASLLTRPA